MSIPFDGLKSALSHRYALEREIGQGGAATVYLGRDTRHPRSVAVKVLHPELAATLATERFLREIELAAGLTHPHILPVLDSGDEGGFLYYAMPYVEGDSLRRRLEGEGELPIPDALRIAREVAEGLAYAHAHGVVHRDVKPENILLAGRHALLADFGVARALVEAGGPELTRPGLAVGTPAYMSPEQASGDGAVDERSDIYALGCVLYEMLAGRPPLTGRTPQATVARRMTETPPSLRHVRETVSPGLERVVQRALARSPADRFRTAEELGEALRRVSREGREAGLGEARRPDAGPVERGRAAAASTMGWVPGRRRKVAVLVASLVAAGGLFALGWAALGPGRAADRAGVPGVPAAAFDLTSIAVLPFDDESEEGRLGHLAAGFTRGLIRELHGVEALEVVSYNGVEPFAGSKVGTDSIARALGVGTLVSGAVTQSGDVLRVSVDLIHASTGALLDMKTLERPRGELFALQDDIAREVARFLRSRLGVEIRLQSRMAATASPEAWELVQRAEELGGEERAHWRAGRTPEALRALERADSLLARAETLSRDWAEPTILRGWVAERRALLSGPTPRTYEEALAGQALEHAERALGRQPGSPEALELRGTVRFGLHRQAGDPEEAARLLAAARQDLGRAVEARPSLASAWNTLSRLHQSQGEYREAMGAAQRAHEEDAFLAEDAAIVSRLGQMALELGDYEEALRWAEEGRRLYNEIVDFPALELLTLASDPPGTRPDPERAWRLYEKIGAKSSPGNRPRFLPMARMQVAAVLALAGMEDSARSVILGTREPLDEGLGALIGYYEANAWLRLGEREEALEALRRHLEAHPARKTLIARDAWFESLRDDLRFQGLVGDGTG